MKSIFLPPEKTPTRAGILLLQRVLINCLIALLLFCSVFIVILKYVSACNIDFIFGYCMTLHMLHCSQNEKKK